MNKFILMAAAAAIALYGCTGISHPEGLPMPKMTFENYQPIMLNVQSSQVVEVYTQANDQQDIAGQFVVPPAEAVKQYAAKRFPASGVGDGQFMIAIEDARVHLRSIEEKNKVLSWSGIGEEDEYRVFLRLRVSPVPNGTRSSASTILKFDRTLVMPSSVSVAQREERQLKFLEKLMADVDASIMNALNDLPNIRQ